MADTPPTSVFVTPDARIASVFVEWLTEKGIEAGVKSEVPKSEVEVLTGMTNMDTPTEFEVMVTDPARVEEAKQLLADRIEEVKELQAKREARANRTGTVTAVCEECGKSSEWPASEMGTTQDCPSCGSYMDIPDPDDEWANLDVGEEDGENE